MAVIPMEYGGDNSLGTRVQLTDNVEYTCPSDGYFRIYCAQTAGSSCAGYIDGQELMYLAANSTAPSLAHYILQAVYVRQGTKIKYTGTSSYSNGYFYPL